MSDLPSTDQALGWLTEQIGGLSRLRNGSPRSQEFRQWRQATLTATQRIWPNDQERSERFRRIPFSPSSTRADDRTAREAFDRGCSEAKRIIRMWIAEIKHHGIAEPEGKPKTTADKATAPKVTIAKATPLPAADPDAKTPSAADAKAKGRLKEMLGLAPAPPESEPAPQLPEIAVPDARDHAAHKKRAKPRTTRAAVKPARLPAAAASTAAGTPAGAPASAGGSEESPTLGDILGLSIAEALERSRTDEGADPAEPTAAAATHAAPVSAPPGLTDSRLSAAALELAGLAAELDRLDVPEADRERVSAALVALVQQLHAGTLDATRVRETATIVVSYPSLARRALPLLMPFYEGAA